MLVEQSDDVCVEPVETSDSFNEFLALHHISMIFKILDFVKCFEVRFSQKRPAQFGVGRYVGKEKRHRR